MDFFEKDLETIIFNSDKDQLLERGLNLTGGRLFRQLKIGNYGIADLVHVYTEYDEGILVMRGEIKNCLIVNVIELKKDKIGISAFLQAAGYIKGILNFLKKRGFSHNVKINMTLIGRDIDSSGNFCFLPSILNQNDENEGYKDNSLIFEAYTYKYDFNGITFNKLSGFKLSDEGF